ncbi:MAG TPA: pyrroline-5-carboxylate reductase, partial [Candidatus Thermoplasmatota archaeon]|nr:pyrroline-5-carboxylate reductase [Candidatus Thermoplasmatota archaeon]
CVAANRSAVIGADVVILAVKPQIMDAVCAEVAPALEEGALVVSVAAGVPTARLEVLLAGHPVVRAMPNLAAVAGFGATAICAGTHAKPEHVQLARDIFSSVGSVEEVPERLMDAVTGISGTGPMYVFHLVEGLADAGVKVGLSREVATRLAVQTVVGSARLLQDSPLHPAALKDQVTSPGGTAIAALHVLRREAFQSILMDAVEAATERSRALGRGE